MINEFNGYLEKRINALVSNDDIVSNALKYSLIECSGKRIRPLCVLTSAVTLDKQSKEAALDLAVALECIHTYSLIHDDLPCMDNDSLRRGKPTNHIVFGEEYALLAGDALNTLAFEVIASSNALDASQVKFGVHALASMAGVNGMVLGQCIDLSSEDKQIDFDTLKQLHIKKTGCLLAASLLLGAIAAKRYDLLKQCENVGYALGLAFQIQDDIFDVTKTSEQLGKSNSDIDNNKSTSVSLLGLDNAKQLADQCFDYVLNSINTIYGSDCTELIAMVESIIKRSY